MMLHTKTYVIKDDVGFYYEFTTHCFKWTPGVIFRDLKISEIQNATSIFYDFLILLNESGLTRQATYV
jgi:hypothetical protein